MPDSLPASPLYHVVARVGGPSRFDRHAETLYEGPDLAMAHEAYRQAIPIAQAAPVDAKATVTIYQMVDDEPVPEPGCRFDAAAWRASLARPAIPDLAAGLQAAGAAVGLGGAL